MATARDEELCRWLPTPIAEAWADACDATEPRERARFAEETLLACLRYLVALQLLTLRSAAASPGTRRAIGYLDKPRLGSWAELVAALAKERQPDDTAAAEINAWLAMKGRDAPLGLIKRLVERRNDLSHEHRTGDAHGLESEAFVQEVQRLLQGLKGVARWELWWIRATALQPDFSSHGKRVRFVGADRPRPADDKWCAPLRQDSCYLRGPDGRFWPTDRLIALKRVGARDVVLFPKKLEDGGMVLSGRFIDDPCQRVELAGDPVIALLALGREPLPTLARAAATPSPPPPSPAHDPRTVAAGARAYAFAGRAVAVALGLSALGGALWAASDRIAGVVAPAAPSNSGSGLAAASASSGAVAPPPEAVTVSATPSSAAAPADVDDPFTALRDLQAGCASPLATPAPSALAAALAALAVDEPRSDADATALDAALDLDRACDRAVIAGLAERLRAPAEDEVGAARRALMLERRLVDRAPAAARGNAALRALSDLRRLMRWIEGDLGARLGDAGQEQQVAALLDLGVDLVCAAHEAGSFDGGAPPSQPLLPPEWPLRLGAHALARPPGGDGAGRSARCVATWLEREAAALVAGGSAADPAGAQLALLAARLRRLAAPCCGAADTTGAGCGDRVAACGALQASVAAMGRLCGDAAASAEARRDACVLAASLAALRLEARAGLSARDPRCLPAELTLAGAAAALAELRRIQPAPTAAWPGGQGPTLPLDPDLDAWVAACDAAAAALVAAPTTADADRAAALRVAVARVLAAARLARVDSGCRLPTRADADGALRARWLDLERSEDPAVAAEASAIACRLEAADGEPEALQARHQRGACPP